MLAGLDDRATGKADRRAAAFDGMLTDATGTAPFVMHALDIVDVHIWAPGSSSAYQEQVTDETSGHTSSVLVLVPDSFIASAGGRQDEGPENRAFVLYDRMS